MKEWVLLGSFWESDNRKAERSRLINGSVGIYSASYSEFSLLVSELPILNINFEQMPFQLCSLKGRHNWSKWLVYERDNPKNQKEHSLPLNWSFSVRSQRCTGVFNCRILDWYLIFECHRFDWLPIVFSLQRVLKWVKRVFFREKKMFKSWRRGMIQLKEQERRKGSKANGVQTNWRSCCVLWWDIPSILLVRTWNRFLLNQLIIMTSSECFQKSLVQGVANNVKDSVKSWLPKFPKEEGKVCCIGVFQNCWIFVKMML